MGIKNISLNHGYNYIDDESLVKKTMELLKENETEVGKLPQHLLKTIVHSMSENKPVVSEFCKETKEWLKVNNSTLVGVNMPIDLSEFISFLKEQEDFCNCYIFRCGKRNIWIVVNEADYNTTVKYMSKAREILNTNYLKYDLMIYSLDEREEVIEELEGSLYDYKEITRGY